MTCQYLISFTRNTVFASERLPSQQIPDVEIAPAIKPDEYQAGHFWELCRIIGIRREQAIMTIESSTGPLVWLPKGRNEETDSRIQVIYSDRRSSRDKFSNRSIISHILRTL
jgi:hypothetical protein